MGREIRLEVLLWLLVLYLSNARELERMRRARFGETRRFELIEEIKSNSDKRSKSSAQSRE